jgi:hypothetical protein
MPGGTTAIHLRIVLQQLMMQYCLSYPVHEDSMGTKYWLEHQVPETAQA